MEIKIDLDMNQIDYDVINKQIQEKIAEMDLAANYNFKYKIENRIDEEVVQCVTDFFRTRRWGDLNDSSKREMSDVMYNKVRQIIEPHVEDIFNQIPKEELHGIISDLIPKVLIDLLASHIQDLVSGYYYSSEVNTMRICEERISNILGR